MYLPAHFEQAQADALHGLLHAQPLGALVTAANGLLNAEYLPFLLDAGGPGPAVLRAHVARANPVWHGTTGEPADCLVLFQGPSAYISPSWYAAKQTTHQVVPTYNYMVVQASGRMRAIEDAGWIRTLLGDLTERFESARVQPWRVADAPANYIDAQMRAVVGIEIEVRELRGKWKMSQNRSAVDRHTIAQRLREEPQAEAGRLAEFIPMDPHA